MSIIDFIKSLFSSKEKERNAELMLENEKLRRRIKEMSEQIERLSSSNQKHINSEKDADNEIEELEDELQKIKKKLKTVQALNTRYLTEIQEYKVSIETLKCQLQGEK